MKSNIYALIIIIGVYSPTICHAQTGCNAGNESPGFTNIGNFAADFLLGVKFNVPTSGTLNSLNLWGLGTNANVQMALYNDNSGVPGNLFISSVQGTVTTGIVSLSVTPTFIPSGNYWLMAIYDNIGDQTYQTTSVTGSAFYQSLSFGSAIPANASGFSSYCCRDFHYWMQISCITGIDQLYNFSDIRIFPNPFIDALNIHIKENEQAEIILYDNLSQKLFQQEFKNSTTINTEQLAQGIYFYEVRNKNVAIKKGKVVKE